MALGKNKYDEINGEYFGYALYNDNRSCVGHVFVKFKNEFLPRVYIRLRNGRYLWDSFFEYGNNNAYCTFFCTLPRITHQLTYSLRYSRSEDFDGSGFGDGESQNVHVGLFNYCKHVSGNSNLRTNYLSLKRDINGIKLLTDLEQPYIFLLCDCIKKKKN